MFYSSSLRLVHKIARSRSLSGCILRLTRYRPIKILSYLTTLSFQCFNDSIFPELPLQLAAIIDKCSIPDRFREILLAYGVHSQYDEWRKLVDVQGLSKFLPAVHTCQIIWGHHDQYPLALGDTIHQVIHPWYPHFKIDVVDFVADTIVIKKRLKFFHNKLLIFSAVCYEYVNFGVNLRIQFWKKIQRVFKSTRGLTLSHG